MFLKFDLTTVAKKTETKKQNQKIQNKASFSFKSCTPRFDDSLELIENKPSPQSYQTIDNLKSGKTTKGPLFKVPSNRSRIDTSILNRVGPQSYYPTYNNTKSKNLGSVSFKFSSRDKAAVREERKCSSVAVGRYDVEKAYSFLEKNGREVPSAIFLSKSIRFGIDNKNATHVLGPGSYDHELKERSDYELKRPSANFNNNLDRFGNSNNLLIVKEENPSPTSYDPHYLSRSTNNLGCRASFVSKSDRFENRSSLARMRHEHSLGPQTYMIESNTMKRKSFLNNRKKLWV